MTEESEKLINNFLQKDVVFFINKEKPIKTGKLLIFKFKDFYFNYSGPRRLPVCGHEAGGKMICAQSSIKAREKKNYYSEFTKPFCLL